MMISKGNEARGNEPTRADWQSGGEGKEEGVVGSGGHAVVVEEDKEGKDRVITRPRESATTQTGT